MMPAERVGVVGAGVMGSEIAQAVASSGLAVTLVDVDPAALERGVAHVRAIGERRVARGRMSPQEAEAIAGRVTPVTEMAGLASCDIVIEAVPEVMDLKRKVWRGIETAAAPGALLATNTSGLSITELGRETSRPGRMIGLHFFNPASVMRLVEVIRGEDTTDATLAEGLALVEQLGKTGVRVKECPGFLVNRVLVRALAEAFRHAHDIAAEWTPAMMAAADAATVAAGPAPMGPFTLADLVGLDTLAHIRDDLHAAYGDRFADGALLAPLVAAGRLGQKTGGGFYTGERPDAEADDAGREVAERYYMGALHETCLCVEEGVATEGDADIAMVLGTGWEAGPVAWARAQGAGAAARMEALAGQAPRFAVPPLLRALATGSAA
ncbi:MAG: 3-hydroxyacyl-CoA dehydrogenase family protein [Actinomycetota bacterium]